MKRKLLYLISFVLLLAASAEAQNRQVKGTVTDASKLPLEGVSLIVPGARKGTITDKSGQFSLSVAKGINSLQVSYLNYQTQVITISEDGPLLITLVPEVKELDQVIVVGYGTQKKKDLTGAVSTINAADVGGRQTVQISEALQGSIAGVSVTRSSGAPGAGSSILIRGITTIGTNSPLIIVDGVPVSNIDNVNPNDVESLSVLKDAASAAIYGSRGAAGVILVTTKRAKEGQSSLEYNYQNGEQKATALPQYVGAQDYMRLFNEQAVNDGATTGPYAQAYINSYLDSNRANPDKFPNTDWTKTLLTHRYAPISRHDLVFTIGNGKIKTKASLGYSRAGAFYDGYTYERYLFRVNNDLQINSKLSANLDIAYKRTNTASPNALAIYESRVMPAIYDDYYSDGRFALGKDGRNPAAQLRAGGYDNGNLNQIVGRLAFNYKPVQGLVLSAQVAPTFDLDKGKSFYKQILFTNPDGSASAVVNQPKTTLSESRAENFTINGQLLADYIKVFKRDHTIDVLAGYEENYNSNESLTASRSGFSLTDFPYLNAGSQEIRDNSGSASASALRSFFGRLKYDFKNKYYIQGNIRSDRSSRFASQYRNAVFPSVSAGWTISKEKFMDHIKWLSFLKLRGSWGKAGNERIGNYPYQATIAFSTALFYQNGVVLPQTGGGQITYAVNNISWETTRTTDFGLDAAFLNNRLTITADYYQKRTFDILLPLDIPLYLGYEKPNQNAGTLDVKGWELEMAWKHKAGKLNYSVALNVSDAKSKIGDLKGTEFRGDQIIRNGSEYNEWFGYLSNGLYQTAADVAGSPVLSTATKVGDVKYVDVNKDGKITSDDKVLLGGALPRYQYGGNIRLDYNSFDFGIAFQGVGTKLSRLNSEITQPFAEAFGNVSQDIVGKFWSAGKTADQNLQSTYPRLSRTSNANNYTLSDFWLINGAYFRVKNITLGYTLKQNFMKKAGIQTCRLYVSVNDLFSISKFPKYLDPESGSYGYPIVTTIMAGATIRF